MKVLVTGGGGFLGGVIVRMLRERGEQVRSFSRGAYTVLAGMGVEQIRGDLVDREAVCKAAKGVRHHFSCCRQGRDLGRL